MNILNFWFKKFLWISFVNYIDGWDWGGSDGSDWAGWAGAWDGAGQGSDGWSDGWAWKSDPAKQTNPDDKFTRWKISQAKKEAAKQVIDGWKTPENNKNNDEDFDKYFNEKLQETLKSYGLDKLNKIDEFESKFEKESFFNQFKEAGKSYEEFWLSIDPTKWGAVLADIETNWFTPAQLILLANSDIIIEKLKWMPKSPMKSDGWSKANIQNGNKTMTDIVAWLREKFLW